MWYLAAALIGILIAAAWTYAVHLRAEREKELQDSAAASRTCLEKRRKREKKGWKKAFKNWQKDRINI